MKKKTIIWGLIIIIALVLIATKAFNLNGNSTAPGIYDDFAKCLTEKGAIFYGSFQCPHCKTQKEMFGNSFQYVNYVECGPLRGPIASECIDAGIEAYPTWIINGIKYTGTQDLSKLSQLTGCPLP
jgi:protein-disulfide isomerase